MGCILLIPFALTYAFGRMVKDQKQGWVVFAAMFVLWAGSVAVATGFEVGGNPAVDDLGVNVTQEVDRPAGRRQHGGQGGPLRPGRLRPVRRHHHRHLDRRGHRRPRQLHARSAARRRW